MDVQIKELPAVRVAYLRYKGPFGPALGEFWKEVFAPWQKAFRLQGRVNYGVAQDDPATTPPDQCRYDACVEVDPDYKIVEPAKEAMLAGGRYAVAQFHGTGDQIPAAWNELYSQWLPASGLKMDARPCLERYAADFAVDPVTGAFNCELCIPVA